MPVITLLSDLGTADISVSKLKIRLLEHLPEAQIVDIVHRISPYNIQQAAYVSLCAYSHFPAVTVHLLLVNIFSGERPRMLLAEKDGYYFIAPDNGILSLIFGEAVGKIWLCAEFNEACTFDQWLQQAIRVINFVQEGSDNFHQHFMPFMIKKIPHLMAPKTVMGGVDCNIVSVDRYGNVVVNITPDRFHELVQGRPFSIRLSREQEVTAISRHYNDVAAGEALCRFNSRGFLEIAVNHGSAANKFELQSMLTRNISYQAITINF